MYLLSRQPTFVVLGETPFYPTQQCRLMYITATGGRPRLDQFDQTLYRSGTCPLHLFINLHAHHIDPTLITHHYYKLSAISEQMHRCGQLRTNVSPQLMPFVSNCLDKPTPILRRFCLHVIWDCPFGAPRIPWNFMFWICAQFRTSKSTNRRWSGQFSASSIQKSIESSSFIYQSHQNQGWSSAGHFTIIIPSSYTHDQHAKAHYITQTHGADILQLPDYLVAPTKPHTSRQF